MCRTLPTPPAMAGLILPIALTSAHSINFYYATTSRSGPPCIQTGTVGVGRGRRKRENRRQKYRENRSLQMTMTKQCSIFCDTDVQ